MSDRTDLRLRVRVNGEEVMREVSPGRLLLDFLRDDLRLTAAKRGCDVQVCGACTVLVDGAPVSSCCYLAADVDRREVVTCEGLAHPGQKSKLQEAFIAVGAFQCGYCTPGMLVTATALLAEHPRPTREQVAEYMKGNLCRCTGYARIVDAILLAGGS
ncbi:MAG TPA: (2Fe-2S)-binding protein [Candidatus Dormibacteraeota bacterium]|jgi:carbon-monoxide dehydrogenase small subunit|nr:(2Fe-2S)-binding protein [Candidatus Dormibacteraeota bacterium]